MILPNEKDRGMLEDVCLKSIKDDPVFLCLEEYFECVKKKLGAIPSNMSKAKVHAFLASRERPDLRLGEAAQCEYWPFDNPAFTPIKQFLTLFNEPT